MQSKQEESPQFYKLKDGKTCLATGFTKKDATDTLWQGPEPVLFSGKSYYSRISKDYGKCENSTTPCDEKDLDSGFDVNAKTKAKIQQARIPDLDWIVSTGLDPKEEACFLPHQEHESH
ncbi:hypothetical protein SRHO_G00019230 [Serrasalmus rhombeus]